MARNRDSAMPYAGRAVSGKDGGYAGVVAGRNGMPGVGHGDGLENVSSKIWEEKVWKH